MCNKKTETMKYSELTKEQQAWYRKGRKAAYLDYRQGTARFHIDKWPSVWYRGYNEAWDAAERVFFGPLD